MADNPIIAKTNCYRCENTIEVKTNKNGNAYWFCTCGFQGRYDKKATNQDFGKIINGANENDGIAKNKTNEATSRNGGGEDARNSSGGGDKPKSSGFNLFR